MNNEYEIEMIVPLGKRKGLILLEEAKGVVSGKITILGNTTNFQGRLSIQGFFIEGALKTSMRTIYYKGHGKLFDNQIEIDLIDGKNIYKIKGRKK